MADEQSKVAGQVAANQLSPAEQQKIASGETKVSVKPQGNTYAVELTNPESGNGGGSTKTVTVPQIATDKAIQLNNLEAQEAAARATALEEYKQAHPELPPLKATAEFTKKVNAGELEYSKPATEFKNAQVDTAPAPVAVPVEDRPITAGDSVTRNDPQVQRAPTDVNIDGTSLPPASTPATRIIEADAKIAETRDQRNQAVAKASELRNQADEAETKSREAEIARSEEQFRADNLKEEADALESSDPEGAARLREQAAEAEDNAAQLAQERDDLEDDAKSLSSEARANDVTAKTLEQDVISAEAEKEALAEEEALAEDELSEEEEELIDEADNDIEEPQELSGPEGSGQQNIDDQALADAPDDKTIKVGEENSQKTKITPIPNPLHNYASYTYGLALHMLSPDDYKEMATDPDGGWVPSKTLIASAGRYGPPGSGFERDPNFEEDFYFDNFKMNTVIGLNSGSQGSNAIDIGFTIIEPYGMTLIDRMMNACEVLDGKNYLELPYLIQIDFYGYDDEGNPTSIIDHRKYIPVKLIEMKIRVGVQGAEYQVKAVPFTHGGFFESVAATPANFEVTAGTLEQFFDAGADESKTIATMQQRKEAAAKAEKDAQNKDPDDTRQAKKEEEAAAANEKAQGAGDGNAYSIRSFVAAYNAWQKATVDNKYQSDCNTIEVKFDKTILESQNKEGGKIVQAEVQSIKQVGDKDSTNNKDAKDAARANTGKNSSQPKFDSGKFSINGGSSITEVINTMMKNSVYVRKQMLDPTKDAETNAEEKKKPIQWWKIVPQIELKKFCTKTGKWNFHIIYHVVSYTVFNRAHPNAPKDMPIGWHKEYHYMYTGQNNDIIEFALDFDTLFYTAVTINRGKVQSTGGAQKSADQEDKLAQDPSFKGYGDKEQAGSGVTPVRIVNREDSLDQTATGNQRKDSVSGVVASVSESIYANAKGDMLSVRLRIVGDPMFIKQDDLYYNPGQARFQDIPYTDPYVKGNTNMIAMDGGEVHCLLTFKTPVDIDEVTGTIRYDGRFLESSFSGIYRVLSVENVLSGGKFEQVLEMIRLQDQPNYDRRPPLANEDRSLKNNSAQKKTPDQIEEDPYPAVLSDWDAVEPDMTVETEQAQMLREQEEGFDAEDPGAEQITETGEDEEDQFPDDPDAEDLSEVANDEDTPTSAIDDESPPAAEEEGDLQEEPSNSSASEAQLSEYRAKVDQAKNALSDQVSIGDDLEEQYENTKEQIAQFESSLSRGIGTPEQRQALELRVKKLYDQMNDLQDDLADARNAERPLRADVIDAEFKLKQAGQPLRS